MDTPKTTPPVSPVHPPVTPPLSPILLPQTPPLDTTPLSCPPAPSKKRKEPSSQPDDEVEYGIFVRRDDGTKRFHKTWDNNLAAHYQKEAFHRMTGSPFPLTTIRSVECEICHVVMTDPFHYMGIDTAYELQGHCKHGPKAGGNVICCGRCYQIECLKWPELKSVGSASMPFIRRQDQFNSTDVAHFKLMVARHLKTVSLKKRTK